MNNPTPGVNKVKNTQEKNKQMNQSYLNQP